MIFHRSFAVPSNAVQAKMRANIVKWIGVAGAGSVYILTALVDEVPEKTGTGLLNAQGKPALKVADNPAHPEWEIFMKFDGEEPVARAEPLGTLITPQGPGYVYARRMLP